MAKLPTKAIGATANYNGANLVCKQDGEYQGVPKLKWFHVGTDEPAFKKINGNITFVSLGSGSPPQTEQKSVAWPGLDKTFAESHIKVIEQERKFTALAVDVALNRYPNLDKDSQTFGMIVNAINNRLVELS